MNIVVAGTTNPAVAALVNVLFNALDAPAIHTGKPWPFSPDSLDFSQVGNVTISVDGPSAKVTFIFHGSQAPTLTGTLDLTKLEAALVQHINAELVLVSNAVPTVLATQNTFYPVSVGGGWTNDLAPQGGCAVNDNGQIVAGVAGRFLTTCTVNFESPAGTNEIVFQIFKNGAPVPDHKAVAWADTTSYPNSVTITGLDDAVPTDVYDLRASCTSASGVSITVTDANFSVVGV